MWAFISIIPIVWGSVLVSTFLGNVSVKPAKGGGHEVVDGAWLWSFVTRKKLERRKIVRGELGQRGGKEDAANSSSSQKGLGLIP